MRRCRGREKHKPARCRLQAITDCAFGQASCARNFMILRKEDKYLVEITIVYYLCTPERLSSLDAASPVYRGAPSRRSPAGQEGRWPRLADYFSPTVLTVQKPAGRRLFPTRYAVTVYGDGRLLLCTLRRGSAGQSAGGASRSRPTS